MGNLKTISTFGDVSAEDDDSILSYFLKTSAVEKIESGDCYAVVGRKGSGKTALTKYFSQPRSEYVTTSPSLRDYPWNQHIKRKNLGASNIESYVSSWRYLIAVKANSIIIEQKRITNMSDSYRAAREFLNENYSGINPDLGEILAPKPTKIGKKIFAPAIMGNSLGSIEFQDENGALGPEVDTLTNALLKNAATIASQIGLKKIALHFDELDQGLSDIDQSRKEMLIGLVLAIRSIRAGQYGSIIKPVFYIRTDIWDKLTFSDKNKITQSSAIYLEWSSDGLQELINERISAKLGTGKNWATIDDKAIMRGSQSKWNHIVTRTFNRPRDVIQFLNFAIDIAVRRSIESNFFTNEDIQSARTQYSRYLKQELDDEIVPHWPLWSDALKTFSEITTLTFNRNTFYEVYNRKRTKDNPLSSDEALETLYGFSIVGYRKGIGRGGSGWVFQYSDPDAGWDNGASQLKVHLGLKEFAKLREERT